MSIANAKAQDPSMEEILASIRRIIADDQDGPKTAPQTGQPSAASLSDDAMADDTVLDLAELGVAPHLPAAPSAPDLDIDVPDLTFGERDPDVAKPAPAPVEASADAESFDSKVAPEPAPPTPTPPPDPEPARLDTLVSRETNASVAQAFGLLSHTVLTQNTHTLEDLVREMLKPMLKVWLDDNLPPLVERLVRNEIERVARGGR